MYLTELLNKKVFDLNNEDYGKVKDIIISSDRTYPLIEAIKIRANGENYFIPSSNIEKITKTKIKLNKPTTQQPKQQPQQPKKQTER